MNISDRSRLYAFRQQGFFVIPSFLGGARRAELRRACDLVLGSTRDRSKETGHTTPRISLLAEGGDTSDVRSARVLVATFIASPDVCAYLLGLARSGQADLPRLKDAHYYHEQSKHDWDGDWHRDSQFGRPDPEVERSVVATTTSVHFRVALEDDDRLEIVPGSHDRWDSPEELQIRRGADRASSAMPHATRIVLRAGDACVFHAWSIHRATYRREPVRRTIDALFSYAQPGAAKAFPDHLNG